MLFDPSSRADKPLTAPPSSLVAHCSRFLWTAALEAAVHRSDWQDHLTCFVVACATVSVTPGGGTPVHLDKVTVVGDPLNLYQITTRGQEVVVRVAYTRLREAFMDVP